MEHTQPKHQALAIWNPVTDRWELEQETIFGHSDAYSETWPTSGMTANGVAYELPTWEHHTADTEYSSSQHGEGSLLPTPTASEASGAGQPPNKTGGPNLRTAIALLPTPTAERPDGRKSEQFAKGRANFYEIIKEDQWGKYFDAITRWERIHGIAPPPTVESPGGKQQLNAKFVEWLMGLEPGHVTAVPGLSRTTELRALGNGVHKQQAVAALKNMLEAS